MITDVTATINSLLCTGVIITLLFYRRSETSRHRLWISRLAGTILVAYGSVPLAYLCGIYPQSSWPIVLANLLVLISLLSVRGNVARLVDLLRQ
ncbi:phage holin family protein [Enterobacteriaceae bacterium ESL0689]|nr:phage holin family protein [Enterobacteriaceae bacterium ESL0689]MDF7681902.1 phage holin family protein [Enterobacteriaceae bacterium ESL0689]